MAFIVPPIMSMELAKQHLQDLHAIAEQSRRRRAAPSRREGDGRRPTRAGCSAARPRRRIAHLHRRLPRWRTQHLKES